MITKYLYPLISCICITNNRPEHLLRAIIFFDAQNYPNRELIVSYPENDDVTKNLLQQILAVAKLNLIALERGETVSIGSARNEAINKCNGQYICTWDDDDWHRDVRLMYQFTILRAARQKREASILTKIVLYNTQTHTGCISKPYCWSGTLLCNREIVHCHPYIDANFGEEEYLLRYLQFSNYLCYFDNHNIYAFIYHGKNMITSKRFSNHYNSESVLDEESKRWLLSQVYLNVTINV
jgi:glycosyltransferase involved in cell wall biosynthesis